MDNKTNYPNAKKEESSIEKVRKSKKPRHMDEFKSLKNRTAKAFQSSYLSYINEIIDEAIVENP